MKFFIALIVIVLSGCDGGKVDLSKPFTCLDISPMLIRIKQSGLVMGGILYPLYQANAASTPVLTNAVFRSRDGLEEISVVQYNSDGKISVSHMKFDTPIDEIVGGYDVMDSHKIFEKGSGEAVNPQPFYHSKNQGCHN